MMCMWPQRSVQLVIGHLDLARAETRPPTPCREREDRCPSQNLWGARMVVVRDVLRSTVVKVCGNHYAELGSSWKAERTASSHRCSASTGSRPGPSSVSLGTCPCLTSVDQSLTAEHRTLRHHMRASHVRRSRISPLAGGETGRRQGRLTGGPRQVVRSLGIASPGLSSDPGLHRLPARGLHPEQRPHYRD
ncbi:unnamed protein product [Rangifer tarandus platyrhynchus]|uniref:Uncharacterized protein n=2 Tax=Rangifer tarandus platyrhynchus TaxID=3082113 RepID=A0ABN8ZYF3_RANTA|nr:unnamed protein product [Rangifer tarandus platyrhynchus]CAI9712072.1 unnamed protein product [Rangifer tarandus platyrhynchus]